MINQFRNPFVNPFVNPFMAVPGFGGISPFASQIGGVSPFTSQMGGFGVNPLVNPFFNPFSSVPTTGGINPLTSQMGGINPLASQVGGFGTNLLTGGYGATGQFGAPFNPFAGGQGQSQFNPLAGGLGQSQFGHQAGGIGQSWAGINPAVAAQAFTNPAILSDPMVQALLAQQLPIRSLTGSPHLGASQQHIPGLTPQVTGQQWVDPYTAFVQAQLLSQLVHNPLLQLTRGYGGAEAGGLGGQFIGGQSFQTPLTNYPFGV